MSADRDEVLRKSLADKGYTLGAAIGIAPAPGSVCDAETPSAYMMPGGGYGCRCVVCPRCNQHTGNSHQGHYWRACKVLAERVRASLAPGETLPVGEFMKRTTREFHFCCGNEFGCELEQAVSGTERAGDGSGQ